MKFFCLLSLLLAMTTQAAPADPVLTADAMRVAVPAGEYRAGARSARVAASATFTVEPPGSAPATEQHALATDQPHLWWGGTHLEKLRAGGTPLPDCLEPGSVVVKLPDGTVMQRDKDYLLDEKWAGLSRIESGRIGKDVKVTIDFHIGHMRLDSIVVDEAGRASLRKGDEVMTAPLPPKLIDGEVAIANVFVPYHARAIEAWQLFPITETIFPEPGAAEMRRRGETFVPKTLAKLRAGEPVMIVTWGDSVTAGGDASSPAKAFAQRFPAELQGRFPKSKITAHNAGIGATNSEQRLPALRKEVLDFHPDLVTIEFVNDMGHPEAAVRQRYAEIFKQIRAAGAEPLLITPHFTMPEMMGLPHPRGKESRPTVPLLRQIAAEHHVGLADTSKRWEHLELEGIPYATLLDNGINHPDDRGHAMFVKDLMTFFPSP